MLMIQTMRLFIFHTCFFPFLMCQLPERERQVIALRFYHGLTQQRAAGILHISQVQVSRLERRAVERLREWLAT